MFIFALLIIGFKVAAKNTDAGFWFACKARSLAHIRIYVPADIMKPVDQKTRKAV
jgi:hypothetical protein